MLHKESRCKKETNGIYGIDVKRVIKAVSFSGSKY